ncbi:inositol-3-phosphate synthase, partial [Nocardioides sp.]|uniref:inositol-3-phosphate synthase n=1 Tax=Nocardioides sp. TaxID=35761 RepID=UPI0027336974
MDTLGIWFVGARGSLATTATVGLHALAAGLTERTGCVTEHPEIDGRGLVEHDRIRVGGHDVVDTALGKRAEQLVAGGVVPGHLIASVGSGLEDTERRLRHGVDAAGTTARGQRAEVERLADDIRAFGADLDRVVVVDVSSTEQPHDPGEAADSWAALSRAWEAGRAPLSPSSM